MRKVTIGGLAGTGKDTVGKMLARRLGVRHFAAGDIFRLLANKRGVSTEELELLAETDTAVDSEVDEHTRLIARTRSGYVINSRLGWCFAQQSLKVLLVSDFEERIRRVAIREGVSYEKAELATLHREAEAQVRFKKYYHLDNFLDIRHYDCVIDTTKLTPEQIVGMIEEIIYNKEILRQCAFSQPV